MMNLNPVTVNRYLFVKQQEGALEKSTVVGHRKSRIGDNIASLE